MNASAKRTYRSARDFLRDAAFLLQNRRKIRRALKDGAVSPAFRERLVLAVTGVNACRYCAYVHARLALRAGVPAEELAGYAAGLPEGIPAEELPAVLYAQHWAESDGRPDPAAAQRMVEIYGAEKAEAIEVILRMIRAANLVGNTVDAWLARVASCFHSVA